MNKRTRYSPEVRERAVRLVFEHESEYESRWAALGSVALRIGCTVETLRRWVSQAERDQGRRDGMTTSDRERLKELERENRELKRAKEVLRTASAYVAQAELDDRRRSEPKPTYIPMFTTQRHDRLVTVQCSGFYL